VTIPVARALGPSILRACCAFTGRRAGSADPVWQFRQMGSTRGFWPLAGRTGKNV